MKISTSTKHYISLFVIIALSGIYIALIYKGIKNRDIDLNTVSKITSKVENIGEDIRYGSKGRKSKVFFIKLENLQKKLGKYRFSKKYEDLVNLAERGEIVTAYYVENSNKRENVNIALVQLEKNNKVILPKSEYEQQKSILLYIGIVGLLVHGVIIYYFQKKFNKVSS